jgi:hypothetical protein
MALSQSPTVRALEYVGDRTITLAYGIGEIVLLFWRMTLRLPRLLRSPDLRLPDSGICAALLRGGGGG